MTQAVAASTSFGRGLAAIVLLCACAPEQQFAALGDFALENGEVLRDSRIGYRTFGELDAARSNAVLVTPWAMGTSRDVARQIASGRLLDAEGRYVVAVDAFANGVASSPSNSVAQRGDAFPRFSIRDVVESQYQLLTRVLGVSRLEAVIGTSAGGMQVFQWITAHPEFVGAAVAIAGSPRSSEADRRHWNVPADEVRRMPPRDRNVDLERQAGAIAALDVSAPFGGSMERAAAAVRAKLLVIVAERDEVVDPAPAMEFARLARAELVVLDGRCGHRATSCERDTIRGAIARFLGGRSR
jgi:homoserine O-acetyltransferase